MYWEDVANSILYYVLYNSSNMLKTIRVCVFILRLYIGDISYSRFVKMYEVI